jgi:hypothetical protein
MGPRRRGTARAAGVHRLDGDATGGCSGGLEIQPAADGSRNATKIPARATREAKERKMSDDDRHLDKEYVFPQGIIRGLGLLPGGERKKWPDASTTTKSTVKDPEGVGKEPEGVGAEPEGVGQPAVSHDETTMSKGVEIPLLSSAPPAAAKTNLQTAGHLVAAPKEYAPKFDPRGFWYTQGAFPSSAPQAGHGVWQQVGQHWIWCPSSVTNLPHNLMAVCQVGSPGPGWVQVFNNYWVAKQQQIAVS